MFDLLEISREVVEAKIADLTAKIVKELEEQGHVLTGKLRDSIVYAIDRRPLMVQAMIYLEDYGVAIDGGIPKENIPFSRGSGAGQSDFIDALIDYFVKRGNDEETAKRYAFATANKQRYHDGMPTSGSYKFSSNGRRLYFFTGTIERFKDELDSIPEEISDKAMQALESVVKKLAIDRELLIKV